MPQEKNQVDAEEIIAKMPQENNQVDAVRVESLRLPQLLVNLETRPGQTSTGAEATEHIAVERAVIVANGERGGSGVAVRTRSMSASNDVMVGVHVGLETMVKMRELFASPPQNEAVQQPMRQNGMATQVDEEVSDPFDDNEGYNLR